MDNIELVPLELITSNRDAIRKAREAALISMAKTIEPSGLNRRDEIWSIYLFMYPFHLSANHVTYISFTIIENFVTVLSIFTKLQPVAPEES